MTTVKVRVESVHVEYGGCGSHELEVDLEFGSLGGDKTLAKEMRMEADRIDPPDGDDQQSYAELKQERDDLIEACRHVVAHRNGRTEFILAASIDHVQTVMTRLGAYR